MLQRLPLRVHGQGMDPPPVMLILAFRLSLPYDTKYPLWTCSSCFRAVCHITVYYNALAINVTPG